MWAWLSNGVERKSCSKEFEKKQFSKHEQYQWVTDFKACDLLKLDQMKSFYNRAYANEMKRYYTYTTE